MYYGAIEEVDHWVGFIINELKKKNLYDKTLIIFTSDHGEMLGKLVWVCLLLQWEFTFFPT